MNNNRQTIKAILFKGFMVGKTRTKLTKDSNIIMFAREKNAKRGQKKPSYPSKQTILLTFAAETTSRYHYPWTIFPATHSCCSPPSICCCATANTIHSPTSAQPSMPTRTTYASPSHARAMPTCPTSASSDRCPERFYLLINSVLLVTLINQYQFLAFV